MEGGCSNHSLFSARWQCCSWASDLVELMATDNDFLKGFHTYSHIGGGGQDTHPIAVFAKRTGCEVVSHANSVLGQGEGVSYAFPYLLPYWQLRRIISVQVLPSSRSFFVQYRRLATGKTHCFQVKDGMLLPGSDKQLMKPPHLLLQKLITFKSVLSERGLCHGP